MAIRAPSVWINAGRSRTRSDFLAIPTWSTQSKSTLSSSLEFPEVTPAMEALRKQPYPSALPDNSIFEDISDEYSLPPLQFRAVPHDTRLRKLVCDSQFSAAERLRRDLTELGIPIRPHSEFERAALYALRKPGKDEERVESFANWFSLIPEAHDSPPRSFYAIRQALFSTVDVPDPGLVMCFGHICASKGYGMKVARHVLQVVVSLAPPQVSVPYLKEFEVKALHYDETQNSRKSAFNTSGRLHSIAIRTQCNAGRVYDAVMMFRLARERDIPIFASAFSRLLRAVRNGHQQYEPLLTQTGRGIPVRFGASPSKDVPSPTAVDPDPAFFMIPEGISPAEVYSEWAPVRKLIVSASIPDNIPSPKVLLYMIRLYKNMGKQEELFDLRRQAFRQSPATAAWWILAELLYYQQRSDWRRLLITFASYNYLIGVPSDHIRDLLDKKSKGYEPVSPKKFLFPVYPMPSKLIPPRQHASLAWEAAVERTRDPGALDDLYNALLRQASNPTAHIVERASASHFTAFLRRFCRRVGPQRGTAVLADMVNLGLRPDAYQLTVVASAYAKRNMVQQAMLILHRMETGRPKEKEAIDGLGAHGQGEGEERLFPEPTIVTYTSLIQKFLIVGNVKAAIMVAERLEKNLSYLPGSNEQTDQALAMLDRATRHHNGSVPLSSRGESPDTERSS